MTVRCLRFVLPEDPDNMGSTLCSRRNLKARFFAYYPDTDFACCDIVI